MDMKALSAMGFNAEQAKLVAALLAAQGKTEKKAEKAAPFGVKITQKGAVFTVAFPSSKFRNLRCKAAGAVWHTEERCWAFPTKELAEAFKKSEEALMKEAVAACSYDSDIIKATKDGLHIHLFKPQRGYKKDGKLVEVDPIARLVEHSFSCWDDYIRNDKDGYYAIHPCNFNDFATALFPVLAAYYPHKVVSK